MTAMVAYALYQPKPSPVNCWSGSEPARSDPHGLFKEQHWFERDVQPMPLVSPSGKIFCDDGEYRRVPFATAAVRLTYSATTGSLATALIASALVQRATVTTRLRSGSQGANTK